MEFAARHYFESVADWQMSWETWGGYYVPLDETLVDSIHGLLGCEEGQLILTEPWLATRFRRSGLEPPS